MKHRIEAELMMMALDLRFAARMPPECMGQRLTTQRLQEMAAMLEQARQWLGPTAHAEVIAANDAALTPTARGYRAKFPIR